MKKLIVPIRKKISFIYIYIINFAYYILYVLHLTMSFVFFLVALSRVSVLRLEKP